MGKGQYLGEFELVVLLALARQEGAAGGMRIYDTIVELTGRDVSAPAVYVTLTRLAAKGLAEAADADGAEARVRRVFRLTPAGARAIDQSRQMLGSLLAAPPRATP